MQERVIENWLDRASELSFQVPFCQMLSAEGHTVVHLTRHCGMELGKDVLSIAPDGVPCAFQLKGAPGGRITLKRWREEELNTQAFDLVVGKITHPSIESKQHHRAYFVTNGTIDEEVSAAIDAMNRQWQDSGMPHLRLRTIVRGELLSKAKALEDNLWPTELPDFKVLLELYLHDGRGPFPKAQFVSLLEKTLPLVVESGKKPPARELCSRAIASTGVLCSLACFGFNRESNYVAELEAWTLYVAYAFALAIKWKLQAKIWRPQIDIALMHLYNTLVLLHDESKDMRTLIGDEGILDKPFVGIRSTIVAGMLSVLEHWPIDPNAVSYGSTVVEFCRRNRSQFTVWSEAAIPYWLAIFWHLRRHDATAAVDFVLRDMIAFIAERNHPDSHSALANPYYELSELLPHVLGLAESELQETFRGRSYMLQGLVHLFVRRNWKQAMKRLWPDVSRIGFMQFQPHGSHEFFVWHCPEGINRSVFPKHTQSWNELMAVAEESDGDAVPEIAQAYPHFVLLYLLVCPHRANASAVRWLDSALSQ